MALKFFNTMTRQKELFVPIDNNKVRMYTCGPTVYNFAHIGNLRTFMFEDLLRRYLKFKGYDVLQVMNLTDVDDKTIRGAIEQKLPLSEYTEKYKRAFFDDIDALNMERADIYPAATDHIEEMVAIVAKLIEDGKAYESQGSIYYKISSFPDYGKLSHMDMDQLKAGARVASDEYEKEQVSDFALWKAWDAEDGDVYWETELGKGRPGWHIECSAMSMKYLGEHFDIHTGGVDNIFPHHENEIAQSEAATGKPFANFWMHSEHLMVEGKRMAKSLGNFYTLRDLLDKGYPALAVRYVLLATHYRMQLNFTFDGLDAAKKALERYNDFIVNLESYSGDGAGGEAGGIVLKALQDFEAALDDDLNISEALGVVFNFIRDINRHRAEGTLSPDEKQAALDTIIKFDSVLGLKRVEDTDLDEEVEAMIDARNIARKEKNFAESDRIRDELLARGIVLEDTAQGTKWKRKL